MSGRGAAPHPEELRLGIIAVSPINQIVAPALYRSALVRSGEASALDPASAESALEARPASAR